MSGNDQEQLSSLVSRVAATVPKSAPPPPAAVSEPEVGPSEAEEIVATAPAAPAEDPAAKYLSAAPQPPAYRAPEQEPQQEAPAAEKPKAPAAPVKKARSVSVEVGSVRDSASALDVQAAINAATSTVQAGVTVMALQSGYATEMTALSFQEIMALQASNVDPHSERLKMFRTLYRRMMNTSVRMDLNSFLKSTAAADVNTLQFGLYAATYPGENEYEIKCRFCGAENKCVHVPNELVSVNSDEIFGRIKELLNPNGNREAAFKESLVNKTAQFELPVKLIVAEICNPSIQDELDHIQYYSERVDPQTGRPSPGNEGIDSVITLVMHVKRLLLPVPGQPGNYYPVEGYHQKLNVISKLGQEDGQALSDAVESEIKRLAVDYKVPDFNCAVCKKKNDDLFLNFERVLFTKMAKRA